MQSSVECPDSEYRLWVPAKERSNSLIVHMTASTFWSRLNFVVLL